jgi:hypothetical protein
MIVNSLYKRIADGRLAVITGIADELTLHPSVFYRMIGHSNVREVDQSWFLEKFEKDIIE